MYRVRVLPHKAISWGGSLRLYPEEFNIPGDKWIDTMETLVEVLERPAPPPEPDPIDEAVKQEEDIGASVPDEEPEPEEEEIPEPPRKKKRGRKKRGG